MLNKDKIYYSISEVCKETGLEQHVLRYWETEFPILKPKKNRAGNRAYRMREIKLIKHLKYLLYVEHYTIQGAKKKLQQNRDFEVPEQIQISWPAHNTNLIEDIKEDLKQLQKLIDEL